MGNEKHYKSESWAAACQYPFSTVSYAEVGLYFSVDFQTKFLFIIMQKCLNILPSQPGLIAVERQWIFSFTQ